jgi:hypothetical protein
MGFAKEADMAAWARGFDWVAGYVCPDCVSDPGIKEFIAAEASAERCDFCGRTFDEPIGAVADDVVDLVSRSIVAEYALVENELRWDEGDHQGDYYGTAELLDWELEQPLGAGAFAEAVGNAAKDHFWCERDYYREKPDEAPSHDWDLFVKTVKHPLGRPERPVGLFPMNSIRASGVTSASAPAALWRWSRRNATSTRSTSGSPADGTTLAGACVSTPEVTSRACRPRAAIASVRSPCARTEMP